MKIQRLEPRPKAQRITAWITVLFLVLSLLAVVSPGTASAGTPATSLTIKWGYPGGSFNTARVFSAADLSAMTQVQQAYTFIDSMPAVCIDSAQGVRLTEILTSAGIELSSIQGFDFCSTDGYKNNFTKADLLDTARYYYPNLPTHFSSGAPTAGADDGAYQVDALMAIQEYWLRFATEPDFTQMTGSNAFRLVFGQVDDHTINAKDSAKWVNEIDVTLNGTPVTGVSLSKSTDIITVGNSDTLTAAVEPTGATDQGINWSSDNSSVATVVYGLITGVAAGAANITATTGDGGFSASCAVTVTNSTTSMVIKVNGGSPVTVTAGQIDALNPSGTLRNYSYYSNKGGPYYYTGLGAPLAEILSTYAGVSSADITSLTATGSDNYAVTISDPQTMLFATRYYYPPGGGEAQPMDTIIATRAAGSVTSDPAQLDTLNTLRLMIGQASSTDKNSSNMAKWIKEIDITASSNPSPTLATLNLSGSPSLVYSGAPLTCDLSNLTLTGADSGGNVVSLSGQTVTWAVYSGPATVSGSILTVNSYGTIIVTASIGTVTSNQLSLAVTTGPTSSMIIKVNGGSPVTVTAGQIDALNSGGVLRHYSNYKTGVGQNFFTGLGAPLSGILSQYASVSSDNVQSMEVKGVDGYSATLTHDQAFGALYYYADNTSPGQLVDTIVATRTYGGITDDPGQLGATDTLRLFMGQPDFSTKVSNKMVSLVCEIDITASSNPSPTLATLNLSGSPSLVYSGAPLTCDLSNLTLTGADSGGNVVSLSGQTVTWAVYSGPATVSGSILTINSYGTVAVTASIGTVTSNCLNLAVTTGSTSSMIIKVNGGSPVTVTDDQINALSNGGVLRYYSYWKNGTLNYITAQGATLSDILSQYASVSGSNVQSMTVTGNDGYSKTFTHDGLFGSLYYYATTTDPGQPVSTIIATRTYGGSTTDPGQLGATDALRLLMGQTAYNNFNNTNMVSKVSEIDVTVTVGPEPAHAVYVITPNADAAVYQAGTTPDGIAAMTVNAGVSGLKYFSVNVAPVSSHSGLESVVFTHLRNGVQDSLNVTRADFDTVQTAKAGFNVQPGDLVKAYIVDDLTNDPAFNPTVLQ